MLGREGATAIDRVWNLGAVHGDRGRAKYLRVLHLVPDEEERGDRREEGMKVEQAGPKLSSKVK